MNLCKQAMSENTSKRQPCVNVDLLIVRDGKVLLGLPSSKWEQGQEKLWGIPGNDILFQEAIDDAARRNVRELFKTDIESIKHLGAHENFEFGNHYIGIGLLVTLAGEPQLDASEDWEKWEWLPLNAVPDKLFVSVRYTLDEYRRMIGK